MRDYVTKSYPLVIDFLDYTTNRSATSKIVFNQKDTNTGFIIGELKANGSPVQISSKTRVVVAIKKSDGYTVQNSCNILDSNKGIIEIPFSTQSLVSQGVNYFEIVLLEGDSELVSPRFSFRVVESILDDDTIESANEYGILVDLIVDVEALRSRVERLESDIKSAERLRVLNEESRQTFELTRQNNENTRIATENIRVKQEEFRVSEMARLTELIEEHYNRRLAGGYIHVNTIDERDNLDKPKLKEGMLCHVKEEDIIYQLKSLDNSKPAEWEELRLGGGMVVETLSDRDNIKEDRLFVGLSIFVVENLMEYVYVGEGEWRQTSSNTIYIGGDEPLDKTVLWIDDEDENVDTSLDSDMFSEIKKSIKEIREIAEDAQYVLTHEIDAGYFNDKSPWDEEIEEDEESSTFSNESGEGIEIEEGYKPDLSNGAKGTVERIVLKRGLKQDIENLFEGELGFCIDTEEMYIGNKGRLRLLAKVGGVGSGNGSNNVTGEYVELVSTNGTKYRLRVNDDGDFIVYNSIADTAENPTLDQAPLYKGLIINHCYGGGSLKANIAPCSHGFIELYNSSDKVINLKGLSVQYGELGKDWQCLPLKGLVKPLHSFLIRCGEHTDIYRKTCRFKIHKYDMHWDIPLSANGFKVYLGIGTEPLTVKNPANIDNLWTKQQGYIDLFAFGSVNPSLGIDAYEKSGNADGYIRAGSILTSVHRKDFKDSDSSFLDLEPIDLKTADVKTYTPRCTRDGQWINYYNKLKLYEHKPNMINICFGKDGDSTRTFTWQSSVTHTGFLKYRKKGENIFKVVESEREIAWHYDTDSTVHRVILRDLEEGVYEYIAGEEGKWSDMYEFEVKKPKNRDTIKILMTTDQQGINEEEYRVWEKANKVICENEDFDFTINTGDISNDGAEFAFQWRYYYDFAKNPLCVKPHMTCCGNNDLTRNDVDGRKTDPVAFGWYGTYEQQLLPSCYSWNYGYIHFISLNSNLLQDSEIVDKQIPWLREDMAKPENQKRWTIVYMHESPYTIIKQTNALNKFIDVFAELGVDLVLCGHQHRYSRSYKMGTQDENGNDTIDEENGTYYVMCQATGIKLMGKVQPAPEGQAPWRAKWEAVANPMYIMWDVTYNSITMRPYTIANILPETSNDYNEPELIPYNDSLVITKEGEIPDDGDITKEGAFTLTDDGTMLCDSEEKVILSI